MPADYPKAEDWRAHVREWLKDNFPPSLAGRGNMMIEEDGRPPDDPDYRLWKERIVRRGWGAPTWPVAYGGAGMTPEQAAIFHEELEAVGAWSPIGGMGVMMFGPTLLEFGTEAQKQRHIPPITRGELHWCQGFSEPGAGSDLASLQTRAEDMGDHYLVNGQKVWTSGADFADWCFCLVRTSTASKHAGISFVLFDMRSSGVEVRPIKLIAGNSPFCEMFLTDLRVPKENLVGPENGGWNIAKRLLQHERSDMGKAVGEGSGLGKGESLSDFARRRLGVDEQGRINDPDIRLRVAANEIEQLVLEQTVARAAASHGDGTITSILKNAAMRLTQTRAELVIEMLGHAGLGGEDSPYSADEQAATLFWLWGKAGTIYGGSTEIQNNIIAKRILGLPDPLPPQPQGGR